MMSLVLRVMSITPLAYNMWLYLLLMWLPFLFLYDSKLLNNFLVTALSIESIYILLGLLYRYLYIIHFLVKRWCLWDWIVHDIMLLVIVVVLVDWRVEWGLVNYWLGTGNGWHNNTHILFQILLFLSFSVFSLNLCATIAEDSK